MRSRTGSSTRCVPPPARPPDGRHRARRAGGLEAARGRFPRAVRRASGVRRAAPRRLVSSRRRSISRSRCSSCRTCCACCLPRSLSSSVLEIGCATGELIAAMPIRPGGRRVGIDISEANVRAAQARFPDVEFRCGDFRELAGSRFDVVVLSDVLEHVPDDAAFLRDAAALADTVLRQPAAGGQLAEPAPRATGRTMSPATCVAIRSPTARRWSSAPGSTCCAQARVWVHETRCRAGLATPAPAALRRRVRRVGAEPALRRAVYAAAVGVPPFGRRLFASNLFIAARARGHPGPSPRQVR